MSLSCTECLDNGYRVIDGEARSCPVCAVGAEWERTRHKALKGSGTAGNSEGRMSLPPGGDVLLAQARREAAGLPIGALEEGLPVRGVVNAAVLEEVQEAVLEARSVAVTLSSSLAALLEDIDQGVPKATLLERWRPALEELPQWAEPALVKTGRAKTRKASSVAAPLSAPS